MRRNPESTPARTRRRRTISGSPLPHNTSHGCNRDAQHTTQATPHPRHETRAPQADGLWPSPSVHHALTWRRAQSREGRHTAPVGDAWTARALGEIDERLHTHVLRWQHYIDATHTLSNALKSGREGTLGVRRRRSDPEPSIWLDISQRPPEPLRGVEEASENSVCAAPQTLPGPPPLGRMGGCKLEPCQQRCRSRRPHSPRGPRKLPRSRRRRANAAGTRPLTATCHGCPAGRPRGQELQR